MTVHHVRTNRARKRSVVLLAILSITGGTALRAQLQLATRTAFVTDEQGQVVSGVALSLTDPLGAVLQQQRTDAGGQVRFSSIAPGRYQLRTRAAGSAPFDLPVTIVGALPVEITVRIPTGLTDTVTVDSSVSNEPSSRASVAGGSLSRVPMRLRARGLQDVRDH